MAVPVTLVPATLVARTAPSADAATSTVVSVAADAYTRYDRPTTNFGRTKGWSVDGRYNAWRHTMLKFAIPAPPAGTALSSAKLQAYSLAASTGPGVDVYTTGNNWTETTVTWRTEPTRGTWLKLSGPYPTNTWVEWDVSTAVPPTGGTTSFTLQSNEQRWLGFASRENSTTRSPRLVLTYTPLPTPTPSPPTSSPIVLAVVGDINPPANSSATSASGLNAASIAAADPRAVLLLGDLQYQYGDCTSLVNQFDALWGRLMPKVIATAGRTHDWAHGTDTANYRNHLAGSCAGQTSGQSLANTATGTTIGPDSNYMVDLGAWRVYSLSSALWTYNAAKANAATAWLDDELSQAEAAGDHAVVMMHEPYWTSPTTVHPAASTAQRPWIDVLDRHDVRLVLSGHQHMYERLHPQTPPATRNDSTGTQQFIVGTGGIGFYCPTSTAANSATRQCHTFGWLKVSLNPDGSYSWQFVRTSGGAYTDSGSR